MNSTTNWFDNETTTIHQNELYRDAENDRLAHEAAQPSRIVRVYATAMVSLGSRMISWGNHLQKRSVQANQQAA